MILRAYFLNSTVMQVSTREYVYCISVDRGMYMFTLSLSFPVQRLASFLHCLLRGSPRYSSETTEPQSTKGMFRAPSALQSML